MEFSKAFLTILPSIDVVEQVDKQRFSPQLKAYLQEADQEICKGEATKACWFFMKTLLRKSSKPPADRLAVILGDFVKVTNEDWKQHFPKPVVALVEAGLKTKKEEAASSKRPLDPEEEAPKKSSRKSKAK